MARRESARSVRQDCFRRELCSPFDQVTEKQRRSAVPPAVMHLANLRRQGRSRVMAKLLVTADPPSLRLRRTSWRPPLLVRQDLRLRRVTEIPLVRGRARLYLRGPGPFAFFREIPDAEKCNRAVRCGDLPIFARCHRLCNRRGFVGYGNRRTRLLRTRARRAGTFPIVAEDKCPSPLRRIED